MHGYGYCIEPGWQTPASVEQRPRTAWKSPERPAPRADRPAPVAVLLVAATFFALNIAMSIFSFVQIEGTRELWHAPFR